MNLESFQESLPGFWHHLGGGAASQRDSATKPRAARNELPWVNMRPKCLNLEEVVPISVVAPEDCRSLVKIPVTDFKNFASQ